MLIAAFLLIWTVLAFVVGMFVGLRFRMLEEQEREARIKRWTREEWQR